jgi:hypothetical protein
MRTFIYCALACILSSVSGCHPTFDLKLVTEDPEVAQWRQQITNEVNDHSKRLEELEHGRDSSSAPGEGA